MAPGEEDIFHHVRDFPYFHLPDEIHLNLLHVDLLGYHFQLTKFMVLQVVAGLFLLIVFNGLALASAPDRRPAAAGGTSGRPWPFISATTSCGRPSATATSTATTIAAHGDHDHDEHDHHAHEPAHALADSAYVHPADRYLPFVWTAFFYVLVCNLLGAFPWLGSPTGEINVTGAWPPSRW